MEYLLRTIAAFAALELCSMGCLAEIRYELRGFGSRHAAITLSGPGQEALTVTPSADGTNVRITGVDANFEPTDPGKKLSIISSMHQVKRGGLTDLIINLSGSGEITATPSPSELQIFIRLREERSIPASASDSGDTPSAPASNLPIRVVPGGQKQPVSSDFGTIMMLFPDPASGSGSNKLTTIFSWLAYGSDLIWNWLNGSMPQFDQTFAQSEVITTQASTENNTIRQLQAQLLAAQREIATLKHAQSAQ